jgi:hypothetical protein
LLDGALRNRFTKQVQVATGSIDATRRAVHIPCR